MTDPSDEVASRGRRLRPLVLAQVASVLLVLVLFSLLVRNIMQGSSGGQFVSAIKRGEHPVAPAFDLPVIWNRPGVWPRRALADGRVELAELRGSPVVVNFWASWCIPRKDEAPLLAA